VRASGRAGFDPRGGRPLDARLFQDPTRFRAPTAEELQALPPAYRRLILDYFERLNRPLPPEQGRSRIDRPDALALELGDVHAAAGDHRKAAAEWSRAVGAEGRGFLLVQRRLQQLPDGGASVIPVLADLLGAAPLHPARQKAATLLAIEAGMERRATRLAAELGTITPAAERDGMYVELARRADAAGLYGLAAWSYGQLLERSPDAAAALAIRTRIAELALLAGDTAQQLLVPPLMDGRSQQRRTT
jgi:hypothetical protein